MILFLDLRSQGVGGSVSDEAEVRGGTLQNLQEAIRGRDVLLVTHGFNVDRVHGEAKLDNFHTLLPPGMDTVVVVGILWPGDCRIPIFVDYVVEGNEAIETGQKLATFLNLNFTGALTLSFASHSLGARVILETIRGLDRPSVRRLLIMAGAIDDTCLSNEYADAASKAQSISILASRCDDVLKLAFPLGNPISGIISRGHPYWHAALGREGPSNPYPPGNKLQPDWQIPEEWNYGHHDYLTDHLVLSGYPIPEKLPAPGPNPQSPSGTPASLGPGAWEPAWSAAFAVSRWT